MRDLTYQPGALTACKLRLHCSTQQALGDFFLMNSREYVKPSETLQPTDIHFGRRLLDDRSMFYLRSTYMAGALANLF
jgi:hypothetical protein